MRCIFTGIARDGNGNIVPSSTVTPFLYGTATAVSIYTTLTGPTAVNSTTAGDDGSFTFYIDRFDYNRDQCFDIQISKTGWTTWKWTNVDIKDVVLGTYAIAADKTVSTYLDTIPKGVIYSIASGKTLTFTYPPVIGDYQVFSCEDSTAKVAGLKEANPVWFGAKIDNATDDAAAWQSALDSINSTGGVLDWPVGTSYVGSTLIWPNDGTYAYAIRMVGSSPGPTDGAVATPSGGVSAIRFGGTGYLLDMRNGDSSTLNWIGSIENGHLWGADTADAASGYGCTTATSGGLNIYSAKQAVLRNLQFKGFGTYGIMTSGALYYSTIDNVKMYYNAIGWYGSAANMNGTTIFRSAFSKSGTYGLQLTVGGYPVNIEGCWFESNGGKSISITASPIVNISHSYFEGKANVSDSDIYVNSDGFYNTVVNLIGNNHAPIGGTDTTGRYAAELSNIATLNMIGNRVYTYEVTQKKAINAGLARGLMAGNLWPKADDIIPMTGAAKGNFIWSDSVNPSITNSTVKPTYSKVIPKGSLTFNSNFESNGGIIGWAYTTPGAGVNATSLSGITATTTAGSKVVTIAGGTGSLRIGGAITIAGETFGTDGLAYVLIDDINSKTTIDIAEVAVTGVAGAAVDWNRATSKYVKGLIYDRSVTSKASSGTGEDTLLSTIIPAGMLSTYGGLKVFAAGIKTGANGNKTIKIYFGSASVTFNVAANDTNDWSVTAYMFNTAAGAQVIHVIGFNGTTVVQDYITATEDTTAAMTVKITGECANGADVITQKIWLVECT